MAEKNKYFVEYRAFKDNQYTMTRRVARYTTQWFKTKEEMNNFINNLDEGKTVINSSNKEIV